METGWKETILYHGRNPSSSAEVSQDKKKTYNQTVFSLDTSSERLERNVQTGSIAVVSWKRRIDEDLCS